MTMGAPGDDTARRGRRSRPLPGPGLGADRSSAAPLRLQVKQAMTAMIREDGLAEHDRLPSEAELCAHFAVSRTVVREALAQMVNEGLIYRLQGKGAFVRGRREEQSFIGSTVGFSGELAEKDHVVTRVVLRQAVTAEAAAETGLPQGLPVSLGYIDIACAALGAGLQDPGAGAGLSILGSTGAHLRLVPDAGAVTLNPDRTGYMNRPGFTGG